MKKLLIFIAALGIAAGAVASELTVVSYNLRYENDWDAEAGNGWKERYPFAADQLLFIRPDVFGTQELKSGQIKDLLSKMPQYSYIGVAREDGKEDGEYSAIFYNRDRVKLIDSGTFWISETPDRPSKGWDGQCTRICTWGQFETADGKPFYYFNMHMDHRTPRGWQTYRQQNQGDRRRRRHSAPLGRFQRRPDERGLRRVRQLRHTRRHV